MRARRGGVVEKGEAEWRRCGVWGDVMPGRYSPTLCRVRRHGNLPAMAHARLLPLSLILRTLLSADSRHISHHGVGEDVRQGWLGVLLLPKGNLRVLSCTSFIILHFPHSLHHSHIFYHTLVSVIGHLTILRAPFRRSPVTWDRKKIDSFGNHFRIRRQNTER